MSDGMKRADEVREDIEMKYANQKKFLVAGYEKAKNEQMVHQKQKDRRRYRNLFRRYAYPIGAMKYSLEQ